MNTGSLGRPIFSPHPAYRPRAGLLQICLTVLLSLGLIPSAPTWWPASQREREQQASLRADDFPLMQLPSLRTCSASSMCPVWLEGCWGLEERQPRPRPPTSRDFMRRQKRAHPSKAMGQGCEVGRSPVYGGMWHEKDP